MQSRVSPENVEVLPRTGETLGPTTRRHLRQNREVFGRFFCTTKGTGRRPSSWTLAWQLTLAFDKFSDRPVNSARHRWTPNPKGPPVTRKIKELDFSYIIQVIIDKYIMNILLGLM